MIFISPIISEWIHKDLACDFLDSLRNQFVWRRKSHHVTVLFSSWTEILWTGLPSSWLEIFSQILPESYLWLNSVLEVDRLGYEESPKLVINATKPHQLGERTRFQSLPTKTTGYWTFQIIEQIKNRNNCPRNTESCSRFLVQSGSLCVSVTLA